MNILAAFFLTGLLIAGLKVLVRHLWRSLQPFNNSEALLIPSIEGNANQLSVASDRSTRHDSNFIRITSTRGSTDRVKRLAAHREQERPDLEIGLSAECYVLGAEA